MFCENSLTPLSKGRGELCRGRRPAETAGPVRDGRGGDEEPRQVRGRGQQHPHAAARPRHRAEDPRDLQPEPRALHVAAAGDEVRGEVREAEPRRAAQQRGDGAARAQPARQHRRGHGKCSEPDPGLGNSGNNILINPVVILLGLGLHLRNFGGIHGPSCGGQARTGGRHYFLRLQPDRRRQKSEGTIGQSGAGASEKISSEFFVIEKHFQLYIFETIL